MLYLPINSAASRSLLYSLSALYWLYNSPRANAALAVINTIAHAIPQCDTDTTNTSRNTANHRSNFSNIVSFSSFLFKRFFHLPHFSQLSLCYLPFFLSHFIAIHVIHTYIKAFRFFFFSLPNVRSFHIF